MCGLQGKYMENILTNMVKGKHSFFQGVFCLSLLEDGRNFEWSLKCLGFFVCLLVLFCFVFCCLHVYVNFLAARKRNLPSDVTGASLLPLPRHLPTAACRSPQWSPSHSNGCVPLREFPASSLAVSELNTSCQDSSKTFQKRLRHSASSNYCTRSTLEQKQSCEPPAQRVASPTPAGTTPYQTNSSR